MSPKNLHACRTIEIVLMWAALFAGIAVMITAGCVAQSSSSTTKVLAYHIDSCAQCKYDLPALDNLGYEVEFIGENEATRLGFRTAPGYAVVVDNVVVYTTTNIEDLQ